MKKKVKWKGEVVERKRGRGLIVKIPRFRVCCTAVSTVRVRVGVVVWSKPSAQPRVEEMICRKKAHR